MVKSAPLTDCPLTVVNLRSIASESNMAALSQISTGRGHQSRLPNDGRSSGPADYVLKSHSSVSTLPSSSTTQSSLAPRRPNTSPAAQYQHALNELLAALPALPPSPRIPDARQRQIEVFHRPTILSVTSEDEILALADILLPEMDTEEELLSRPSSSRADYSGLMTVASGSASQQSLRDSRGLTVSINTDQNTDTPITSPEDLTYDDYVNFLPSPSSTSSQLHPCRPLRKRYLSDTPSVTTSETHSSVSLSTPPLSRVSSFQQLSTPPVSPSRVSFSPSTIESPWSGLGVIHERQRSEDALLIDEHKPFIVEEFRVKPTSVDSNRLVRHALPPVEVCTSSLDTIVTGRASTSSSKGSTDTMPSLSPFPSPKSGTFTRLFKATKSVDALFVPKSTSQETKMAKEEEKRRQKQLAKERRERLAREFQNKAKQTNSDAQSTNGYSERHRNAPAWEEEVGGLWNSSAFA